MMRRLLVLCVLVIAIVAAPLSTVQACDGLGGYGYGCGIGWLYQSLQYNVPYYAAFPPVYYSYPVPRTYGYSPFAYPPGVMTPEVVGEVQPLEIVNPYVPSSQQTPADGAKDLRAKADGQPQPLVVINPYAMPTRSVARNGQ